MGEADRRKLAGTCQAPTQPEQSQPLSRGEAISWAWEILAAAEGGSVSGITILPANGGSPIYLSADEVQRAPGRRH